MELELKAVKTSDLDNAALDWAVAKSRGHTEIKVYGPSRPENGDTGWIEVRLNPSASTARYDPSTNWDFGGPIIEREQINLNTVFIQPDVDTVRWQAHRDSGTNDEYQIGLTPLIAAMRCYVASVLGDEVDVPEVLCVKEVHPSPRP